MLGKEERHLKKVEREEHLDRRSYCANTENRSCQWQNRFPCIEAESIYMTT
jgi:hypothetical protein